MIKFTQMNSFLFSFTYEIGGICYSSGVLFTTPCTEEHFNSLIPSIEHTLVWVENSLPDLPAQIAPYLSPKEALIFKETHLVSFSLLFTEAEERSVNLAYGDDGVYLTASFKNGMIHSVDLND